MPATLLRLIGRFFGHYKSTLMLRRLVGVCCNLCLTCCMYHLCHGLQVLIHIVVLYDVEIIGYVPFVLQNSDDSSMLVLRLPLRLRLLRGGSYLVTYTVSHSRHDLLTEEFGRFRFLMKKIYDSKVFKRIKEVSTFHGACHTWDLTSGSHGWHLHRHDILAFAEPVPDLELRLQARADYVAVGGKMDGYRVDVHVERVEVTPEFVAQYCSAFDPSSHAAGSTSKIVSEGHESSWDIARRLVAGNKKALAQWAEFETAVDGHRRFHATGDLSRLIRDCREDVKKQHAHSDSQGMLFDAEGSASSDGEPYFDVRVVAQFYRTDWHNLVVNGWDRLFIYYCRTGREVLVQDFAEALACDASLARQRAPLFGLGGGP